MTDSFLEEIKNLKGKDKVKELITYGVISTVDILNYDNENRENYDNQNYSIEFLKSLQKVDVDFEIPVNLENNISYCPMDVYTGMSHSNNKSTRNEIFYAIIRKKRPDLYPDEIIPIDLYGKLDFVNWGIKYEEKFIFNNIQHVVRSSKITITRNRKDFMVLDKLIYGAGIYHGIDDARSLIQQLKEHPLELERVDFDKKIIGTKVWYNNQKGVITDFHWGTGNVVIAPVEENNFTFFDFNDTNEYKETEDRTVVVSLFSKNVNWIRFD